MEASAVYVWKRLCDVFGVKIEHWPTDVVYATGCVWADSSMSNIWEVHKHGRKLSVSWVTKENLQLRQIREILGFGEIYWTGGLWSWNEMCVCVCTHVFPEELLVLPMQLYLQSHNRKRKCIYHFDFSGWIPCLYLISLLHCFITLFDPDLWKKMELLVNVWCGFILYKREFLLGLVCEI